MMRGMAGYAIRTEDGIRIWWTGDVDASRTLTRTLEEMSAEAFFEKYSTNKPIDQPGDSALIIEKK